MIYVLYFLKEQIVLSVSETLLYFFKNYNSNIKFNFNFLKKP